MDASQKGKKRHRPGRQGPGHIPRQRFMKSVSIPNYKLLHRSEKPWKPKASRFGYIEKKSLESDVLFIMNRITKTNFDKLAEEMKRLAIKTYDGLEYLVEIFLEKATLETEFVTVYAPLCRVLSDIKVPPPPEKGMKENQATFRVVMLTKCQQEFEADKSIIFEDLEEKRKKLMAKMKAKPDKEEKIEEVLYRMKLRRLKFFGNVRFLGELFKLGMLTENVMHDCIFTLLKARDDASLLSLCQLITTVGQMLDTDKAKSHMDQYFTHMEKLAGERSPRIEFILRDVIELRQNHWVPRKGATVAFRQEHAWQKLIIALPLPAHSTKSQPGSQEGSRQRPEEQKANDDGLNTAGSKSMKTDASKGRLSKMPQSTSDIANEFARQVGKLLKNPHTTGEVEGYASNGGEYQAAPAANTPQQAAQMAHPAMVRPPMQGHMLLAQNESEVASQWQNSGLSWATFVGGVPSEVDSYLSDHKLEFTVKPASGNVDVTRLAQQVETLVSQGKANQEIKALIEKLVPPENRDGNFIRALTTAITYASITRPELKVNEDVIKAHREVLQAYINTTGQELQALYAIQALMAKLEHPKGVIFNLFDLLYNEEMISKEALKQWETSSDPSEQEGKAACLMQLTHFFILLH